MKEYVFAELCGCLERPFKIIKKLYKHCVRYVLTCLFVLLQMHALLGRLLFAFDAATPCNTTTRATHIRKLKEIIYTSTKRKEAKGLCMCVVFRVSYAFRIFPY